MLFMPPVIFDRLPINCEMMKWKNAETNALVNISHSDN